MTYLAAILMATLAGENVERAVDGANVWLVVVASNPSPAGIAHAAKDLATKGLDGLIFQTNDCGEKRNVFGVAIEISESASAAKVALQRARGAVKNAYIKRCAVVSRSLLAHRFPAIDSSIAKVPSDTVNWDDSDRVSNVVRLADGRDIIADRLFVEDPEDPLEGRRVRLFLATSSGKGKLLSHDCTWPDHFQEHGGLLAFQCAGEEAGDELLHTVLVFDANGDLVAKAERCRNPILSDSDALTCKEESVDASGRLKLRSKRVDLAHAIAPTRGPNP